MSLVARVELIPGFLRITDDGGAKHQIAIADVLRAADIPALTYSQVGAIKTLANMVVVLIRTLIDRQILNESFMENDDYDLDAIIESIEDMGGDYGEPDLTVT